MLDLPIDFMSEHSKSFEIGARFVSGYGFLGVIKINDKEVFKTGTFKSDFDVAIAAATEHFLQTYRVLIPRKK